EPELTAPPTPEPDTPAGPLADDVSGPDLLAWLDRERERLQDAGLLLKVREAHAHILAARAFNDRNRAIAEADGAAHAARDHLAKLEAAAAKAMDDHVALAVALYDTYTDRTNAVDKLVEYGRTHGAEQALRVLHKRPEAFGPLVRTYPVYGLGVHWTTMPAVRKARKVEASLVEAAVRSAGAAPTIRERLDAKTRVREADKHGGDLRAALRDFPASMTSERKAAELLRSAIRDGADLSWIEQQLGRLLPPGDRAAAEIAENVVRTVFTNPRGGRPREREGPRLGGMDI
ncbi:MAG: hypothetical protein KY444_03725, partial [Gemmatimonadetes bacterium]|nr:hypothetical protein [Gemmatimonadota bacterium]